jgi:hypothetical protein
VTNRSNFESDCKTAETTKLATLQTAATTQQESINAVGVNAGKPPAFGYSAADDLTIRNACKTYYATALSAEATKQVTITNSRAKNLQNNSDVGPI